MNRTYGNIALEPNSKGSMNWCLSNLEPHVSIKLKHIFPRVPKNSAGPFYLDNTPMMCADIEWFLSRYPLSISVTDTKSLKKGRKKFEGQQAEIEQILKPDFNATSQLGLKENQIIRPYQLQAIELLKKRKKLLLGDEGGLGKTYVAAAFLAQTPQALPAAVVCDAHMQSQWQEKIEGFTYLRVHVIEKATPYTLPVADIYIYRISQIGGWIDFFNNEFFKSVIYDEPQSLRRGVETNKGGSAKVLSSKAEYILGLTATPIYNYGVELWNIMQFIDETVLGSYQDFTREWVDENGRIKDPKALGTYLREQYVWLRRLKSDVGLQMPKVSRLVENVDYDTKAVQNVEDLAKTLAIRASTGVFIERGQAARKLDILVRQATGVAKAKSVAQFVRLLVETGQKVLLLGWHREVYDIWNEELKDLNPVMYTGSEGVAHKNKAKQRFISGETDILIMSIRSGAGLDGLQHVCSTAVFGELDWSPGIHQQVIWRLDRDGQTNPVMAWFLVSEEGSDPPIMDVLGIKASEAVQITDPDMGVQTIEDDTSTNIQKLVQLYLNKVKKNAKEESQMSLLA